MKLFIKGLSNFKAHAIAFCLSFSSMLIFNPWAERLMIGNGSINLWHNPTFIVSKLFAVMAVFYFLKLLKDPILRDNLKAYLPFSISLFISMWIKPSFGMSFLPSLGLVFIFLYAKKAISLSFLLRMGFFSSLSIIPFLIILNHVYLDAGTQSTIQILPGLVWGRKSVFIPLSIFLRSGFPLFVTIFYFKKLTIQHIIALTNWFIAITGYYLFAEVGRRLYDGNFGWGYSLSLFFLFFTSLEIIYKNRRNYLFTIANILFFWHFISGVFYFCKILFGYTFY